MPREYGIWASVQSGYWKGALTFLVSRSVWSFSIWDIFSPSVSSGSESEGFRHCAFTLPAAGSADAAVPGCSPMEYKGRLVNCNFGPKM